MTFRQAWVTSSLGRDALWSKILRKVMFIEWTRNWPIRRRCSNFGICFFQPHSLLGKTWAFVFLEEFFSWKSLHRKIVLSSFQRRKYFEYDFTMPWVFEFFLYPAFDREPKLLHEFNSTKALLVVLLKASPKVLTKFLTCSSTHDATIWLLFCVVGSGIPFAIGLAVNSSAGRWVHKKIGTI